MTTVSVTRISKRSELGSSDMDGVMQLQDLMGFSTVRGNPLDLDVLNPNDPNDFVNATGKKPAKKQGFLRTIASNMKARKDMKTKSKADARVLKGQAKLTKATAKVGEAAAKKEAAISAGKDDGTAKLMAAALKKPASAPKEEGMSTSTKLMIGGGVLLVVGVAVFFVIKSRKGKGKGK